MSYAPKFKVGDKVCLVRGRLFLTFPIEVYDIYPDKEADNREGIQGGYHEYICLEEGNKRLYFEHQLILWKDCRDLVIKALEDRLEELRKE